MSRLFPKDEEMKKNKIEPRVRRGLLEIETVLTTSTLIVHTMGEGCAASISSCIQSRDELDSSTRSRRGPVPSVLH